MKINHKKAGEMNADAKSANFKVLNPDGPPVGPGVRDGHPPLPRQDGTTPPAPIPTPSTPAGQPASTRVEASSPTPANQPPGDSGSRPVPHAKTASPKQLEANRKNPKGSTGPTSEAGKRRSSQNS